MKSEDGEIFFPQTQVIVTWVAKAGAAEAAPYMQAPRTVAPARLCSARPCDINRSWHSTRTFFPFFILLQPNTDYFFCRRFRDLQDVCTSAPLIPQKFHEKALPFRELLTKC